MAAGLPTYQDARHWQQYQRFFPSDLQLNATNRPDESYWSWRGLSVHLDRYDNSNAVAKMIIVHGGGGYGRMFFPVGVARREINAEVVAPDLPGYGLTAAPGGYTHDDWVDCVVDLIASERARDQRPIFLLGGSMGGLVAYSAAAKSRDVRGVIATCLVDPRRTEVRRALARVRWVAPVSGSIVSGLASLAGRTRIPIRWLANTSAMSGQQDLSAVVASDPQGGGNRVPLGFLASYLSYQPPVEPEMFDVCPVLVVHPAADTWTPPELTKDFYDRLPVPKQWVSLENAGHLPAEEPGLTQMRRAIASFVVGRS